MISKKELQEQISELKSAISKHATKIYLNEKNIHDLEAGCQDIIRMCCFEHSPAPVSPETLELKKQVQCGVMGHDFKFKKFTSVFRGKGFFVTTFSCGAANTNQEQTLAKQGIFKCEKCGLEITRKLTKQEIEAAKKLGLK